MRKVNKVDGHRSNLPDKNSSNDLGQNLGVDTTSSGVVIVSGVAKKKDNNTRGELIEQNQDALEVWFKIKQNYHKFNYLQITQNLYYFNSY